MTQVGKIAQLTTEPVKAKTPMELAQASKQAGASTVQTKAPDVKTTATLEAHKSVAQVEPMPQNKRPVQGPKVKPRLGIINQPKLTAEEASKIFAELGGNYERKRGKKANMIIVSPSGGGKTHLLKTMPGPIYIDSFDPGGLETLADEIMSGLVIPMDKWEGDNPKTPTMFKAWDDHFLKLYQSGFFEHVGTYCLDSLTTWADALMNHIQALDSRANTNPQQQDYGLQQVLAKTAMKMIAGLPCNCVITAHLSTRKDDVTGQVTTSIMMPGQAAVKIPIEFSEMYVIKSQEINDREKGPMIQRTLLTQNTGKYQAKTRMGRNGLFNMYEPFDLGALMRKAGYSTENKPFLIAK